MSNEIIKIEKIFQNLKRGQCLFIRVHESIVHYHRVEWPLASYLFNMNTKVKLSLNYYNKFNLEQMMIFNKIKDICKEKEYVFDWTDDEMDRLYEYY